MKTFDYKTPENWVRAGIAFVLLVGVTFIVSLFIQKYGVVDLGVVLLLTVGYLMLLFPLLRIMIGTYVRIAYEKITVEDKLLVLHAPKGPIALKWGLIEYLFFRTLPGGTRLYSVRARGGEKIEFYSNIRNPDSLVDIIEAKTNKNFMPAASVQFTT